MIDLIKFDIEKKLNIDLLEKDMHYFTEGATESIVFSINNKYLIKTFDKESFNVQVEFFNKYHNDFFQKIVYANKELLYICFEFIEGSKYKKDLISVDKALDDIYKITSSYELYDYEGYGYLFSDYGKTWKDFLYDEVMYSKQEIENIDIAKVLDSLNIIEKYKIDKYLIHGDFGTHNFLVNNEKIKVIDPMGVVGDYLYDFYFAILSNVDIFMNLDIDRILGYYDRDIEYKKALFLIVLYIRMSRAFKYDKDNFKDYLSLYERIE